MTAFIYNLPEYRSLVEGATVGKETRTKFTNQVRQQRWATRNGFIVSFMEWVKLQMQARNLSRRDLALRCGLPLGTLTLHFSRPSKVKSAYIPIYLYGLGVRISFQSTPVQCLEDMPGFEA